MCTCLEGGVLGREDLLCVCGEGVENIVSWHVFHRNIIIIIITFFRVCSRVDV